MVRKQMVRKRLTDKELENTMFHLSTYKLKKFAKLSGRRGQTARHLLKMQKKGSKVGRR